VVKRNRIAFAVRTTAYHASMVSLVAWGNQRGAGVKQWAAVPKQLNDRAYRHRRRRRGRQVVRSLPFTRNLPSTQDRNHSSRTAHLGSLQPSEAQLYHSLALRRLTFPGTSIPGMSPRIPPILSIHTLPWTIRWRLSTRQHHGWGTSR